MVLYDVATHFRVAAVMKPTVILQCPDISLKKQENETKKQPKKKKIQNEKSYMLLKIVASSDNHLSHCFSFIV